LVAAHYWHFSTESEKYDVDRRDIERLAGYTSDCKMTLSYKYAKSGVLLSFKCENSNSLDIDFPFGYSPSGNREHFIDFASPSGSKSLITQLFSQHIESDRKF
jgi:hypothetical protein